MRKAQLINEIILSFANNNIKEMFLHIDNLYDLLGEAETERVLNAIDKLIYEK